MKTDKHRLWLQEQVRKQRRWIEDHGGSRMGYVARYGSSRGTGTLPVYGDGGDAIYEADMADLARLESELRGSPS